MKTWWQSRGKIALWILVAGAVVVGIALFVASLSTPAEILSAPPPPQRQRLAFLGRWMWPVKTRLLRVREFFVGAPRLVHLNAIVAEIDPARDISKLTVLHTITNQTGDKVLLIRGAGDFRERILDAGGNIVSQPRVATRDGVQARISVTASAPIGAGTNLAPREVGLWLDIVPHVRRQGIEVTCFLTATEAAQEKTAGSERLDAVIKTNVAVGARLTVPPDASVLLVGGMTNSRGKTIAALLSPSAPRQK